MITSDRRPSADGYDEASASGKHGAQRVAERREMHAKRARSPPRARESSLLGFTDAMVRGIEIDALAVDAIRGSRALECDRLPTRRDSGARTQCMRCVIGGG